MTEQLAPIPGVCARFLASCGLRLGANERIALRDLDIVLDASDLTPRERFTIKTGLQQSDRIDFTIARVDAATTIRVSPILLKALDAAGIKDPGDATSRRLTEAQLDLLLAGKPIDQKILLKGLCLEAGILPVQMAAGAFGRPSSLIDHPF